MGKKQSGEKIQREGFDLLVDRKGRKRILTIKPVQGYKVTHVLAYVSSGSVIVYLDPGKPTEKQA